MFPKPRGRGRGIPGQQQQPPPPGFHAAQPAPRGAEAREVEPLKDTEPSRKEKPRSINPEDIGLKFEQMSLKSTLPTRPGYGKLGQKIRLVANCFPLKVPSGNVYHYDVEIVNKKRSTEERGDANVPADKKYRCMSTKRNREVIEEMLNANKQLKGYYPAYDGRKNMYTRRPLEKMKFTLSVVMEDEPKQPSNSQVSRNPDVFEVTIQAVKKKETNSCAISLDPLHALFDHKTSSVPREAIMALETVLRNGPCFRYVPVGRSFFYPPAPEDIHPLGGGREIWFGYHQSLRLGQWHPLVNIDITATTFYQKGEVLKFICEILGTTKETLGRAPLRDAQIVQLSKELKNMRVEVTHLKYPRKYRIVKVTREHADRLEFPITVNGEKKQIKVSDYFQNSYNLRLQYPSLPCLQVAPEAKKVFLPIEVCNLVEGQHCKKKLEEKQNAEMIKFTARKPKDRFDEISEIIRNANFNNDPFVKEFDLKVDTRPLQVEGRILEAPNVRYMSDKKIRPTDGKWDMRGKQFFRGATINAWVLISFANPRFCGEEILRKFSSMLCKIGRESGIVIGQCSSIEIIKYS